MRAIAAVACAIAFAAGCDGRPTAPTTPTVDVPGLTVDVRVSGRVLDFGTSVGVPNVTVLLGNSTTVTDANGSYSLIIPSIGRFDAVVDGRRGGWALVTGSAYRGDLFVNWGLCVGRYGIVTDAQTLRPIAGASVAVAGRRVFSEGDGWYRADACTTNSLVPGVFGGSTGNGAIRASHPLYLETVLNVTSRTISDVLRLDIEMQPPKSGS